MFPGTGNRKWFQLDRMFVGVGFICRKCAVLAVKKAYHTISLLLFFSLKLYLCKVVSCSMLRFKI